MKRLITLSLLSILLISCGQEEMSLDSVLASQDLEAIRAKRSEIKEKEMTLAHELSQLDEAIAKLDSTERLPLITVAELSEEKFVHFVELQGGVMTKNNLLLYPEYAGVLRTVKVKEGQRVSKGQTLAIIDDGGLAQQRSQMKIQADLAQTTFEKQERLWEQKIGSEMDYLRAKSSYEAQAEALTQMDKQLAKTSIKAPFSGIVDEVITEQGSVVAPGMNPVMRIVNLNDMYVEVDVPESQIPYVKKGRKVIAEFPVLGVELESQVRSVGSYINPANRTFKIEVAVPNKDGLIKPNLTAKVKVNDYSNDAAILIPQSVISEDAHGKEYVYVVENKDSKNRAVAKRVYVEVGKTQGDSVEIESGLAAGAELVVEGARAIRDGRRVQIDIK